MAASPVCFTITKSRLARITRLDACGNPVFTGTLNSVVTDGWVKVSHKVNMDSGTDFTTKNAWGDLLITDSDPDRLKNVTIQADFVKVDPDCFDIIAGARSFVQTAAGPSTVGTTIGWAQGSNPNQGAFALELWTKVAGLSCTGGLPLWLYTVYPWLYNGVTMDEDYEDATKTFSFSADSHDADGAGWIHGPYGVKPSFDLAIAKGDHFAHILTNIQPPAVVCGATAISTTPGWPTGYTGPTGPTGP